MYRDRTVLVCVRDRNNAGKRVYWEITSDDDGMYNMLIYDEYKMYTNDGSLGTTRECR